MTASEGSPDDVTSESGPDEDDDHDVAPPPAPVKRAAHAFGSVWDSQIGMPTSSVGSGPMVDDEDLDEPPIPEYLIAERRQRDGRGGASGGRGGASGGRSGYSAAVDRERYGTGRSAPTGRSGGSSRYGEPAPRSGNREPDRFRGDRPPVRLAPRVGNADEPWSEVSPELEAMLRAQIGSRPRPTAPVAPRVVETPAAEMPGLDTPVAKRRATRKPAAEARTATPMAAVVAEAPKRRATRKTATAVEAPIDAAPVTGTAPKPRTTRKAAASTEPTEPAEKAAPKRRTTRKTAEPTD